MSIIDKKILITGVTGTLGGEVAKRYLKEGAMVKGLVRDEKSYKEMKEIGIEPIIGELTNRGSLVEAAKDIDIIIHCAAYLGEDLEKAMNSNVIGVENLASLAIELGIKRFVHISTLSVYGEPTEGYFDENSPITESHPEVYIKTKAQSERILNKYKNNGLGLIILRPGAICAEKNSYWGDRQVERMINTDIVNWVNPDDLIPWVHRDNLIEMIFVAILKGISGEIYNAIDGNYPDKEYRLELINAIGKKYILPERRLERPIYSNKKIKGLGYMPVKTFEETISNLKKLALEHNTYIN